MKTSTAVKILTLVIAVLAKSSWAQPHPRVDLGRMVVNGETYTFAVIDNQGGSSTQRNELEAKIRSELEDLGRALNQTTEDWVIENLKKAYPEIAPKFFDSMRTTSSFADPGSSLIVISKGHTLENTQACLRVVMRTDTNPRLPTEVITGYDFPPGPIEVRPPLEVESFLEGISARSQAEETMRIRENGVRWGRSQIWVPDYQKNFSSTHSLDVEFKSLMRNPEATDEFTPLLFDIANRYALTAKQKTIPVPGPIGTWQVLYPNRYIVSCDKRMLAAYHRMGFEKQLEEPRLGSYVLNMDWKGYLALGYRLAKHKSHENFTGGSGYYDILGERNGISEQIHSADGPLKSFLPSRVSGCPSDYAKLPKMKKSQ